MEPMPGQAPGGGSAPSYKGAKTISEGASITDEEFSSENSAENTLLITGGEVKLSKVSVAKTGDDSGDESDFYGTNAGILAKDNAIVTISDSEVQTNGMHANAVFAYGDATINITDSSIVTESDNSGGIMVTGGGLINADNVLVTTSGRSSAAIRSDRGGGAINVKGGVYTTSGVGSPAIYSTANINVKGALLQSQASEGIVIEGHNTVSLESSTLEATNNKLNGQSTTYKTIFIYQSMSGDATEGEGSFSADNSLITTNQGDHFYITNTKAQINLTGNIFVQNDETGAFLRAEAAAWGNQGSNGGDVFLNVLQQDVIGDIITDKISKVDFRLKQSYFKGAITGEGSVKLTLSADSMAVLTADSYVKELSNETSDNSNIYSNGFKLFVNGTEVAINTEEAPESFLNQNCTFDGQNCFEEEVTETVDTTTTTNNSGSGFPVWGYYVLAVVGAIAIAVLVAVLIMKIRKDKKQEQSNPVINTDVSSGFGGSSNTEQPTEETHPPVVPPFGDNNN